MYIHSPPWWWWWWWLLGGYVFLCIFCNVFLFAFSSPLLSETLQEYIFFCFLHNEASPLLQPKPESESELVQSTHLCTWNMQLQFNEFFQIFFSSSSLVYLFCWLMYVNVLFVRSFVHSVLFTTLPYLPLPAGLAIALVWLYGYAMTIDMIVPQCLSPCLSVDWEKD